MVTVREIIEIIKQGTYVGNLTQIRAGDRAYHLYPSIEITRPQPLSPSLDPQLKTSDEVFEVKIFVRYSREIVLEDDLLNENELEVQRVLGLQPLQEGTFQFQTETWNREQTKNVYGVISTLRVLFRQIVGKEADTVVGGDSVLELDGISLDLVATSNGDIGIASSEALQDDAKRFPIPDGNVGTRFFEYAWTKALYDSVQAVIDARSYVPAKIIESNGDESSWTVLAVRQRDQVSYAGLKTSTIQMEIVN